jgi:hypothetical protein
MPGIYGAVGGGRKFGSCDALELAPSVAVSKNAHQKVGMAGLFEGRDPKSWNGRRFSRLGPNFLGMARVFGLAAMAFLVPRASSGSRA